jgi:hypothetical protein
MKKIIILTIGCLAFFMMQAQIFTSSNLPVISIRTNGQTILDEPKIMADMGIIYNGAGNRNNITDPFSHYNGKIGIEIRGQSSQQFPMKSYSIELWDNAGNSTDKSLFGLPKESDWVLYAPYSDKTLMRNFLAYTMSREMSRWSANCRFVEVILNGSYIGIYVFMEKIKRGSGRVNISKMAATDVSGDAVTGGYIFSIDKEPDGWFSSFKPYSTAANPKIQFSYIYPKLSSLVVEQSVYLKKYVDSFENALSKSTINGHQDDWRKFADEASFIDYLIVNEVSRNVDGYRLSAFFYKDRDSKNGKIFAGPVWDYDLAFRNANYCKGSDVEGWAYAFNTTCPDDYFQIPFWWNHFMNDKAFRENLRCRWKQLRQSGLSLDRINFLIDSIYILTNEARQRHYQKWPTLGKYVWPNPEPIPPSYGAEIDYLKSWIGNRIAWIDKNIPNVGPCSDYPANLPESIIISGFPNPVTESYSLIIKSKLAQKLEILAVDAMGRRIFSKLLSVSEGYNSFGVDMRSWQTGIYIFRFIAASGEEKTEKILKQ